MKKGYTLAEVLIALLVVAIVAAAATPVLTKALVRHKESNVRPWTWSGNAAYSNIGDNSSSIIAMNSAPAGNLPKLLINTDFNERNSINFYYGGGSIGNISVNTQGTQFGQYITPATQTQGVNFSYKGIVSIGNNPASLAAKGSNSVVIGENATALTEGVAVGENAIAGVYSVAMGYNSRAIGTESIAIGADTTASNYSIAIGSNASATAQYSLAIGDNTISSADNTFVIGTNSSITSASGANAILIAHNRQVPPNALTYTTVRLPSSMLLLLNYVNSVVLGSSDMKVILAGKTYSPEVIYATNIMTNSITTSSLNGSSDLRLKNIKDEYTSGMDELNQLKIYNYTFKNDPKKKRVGVVAQELMKIFPGAVSKDSTGYYVIREEDIFYSIVNALKNFDKKIKEITANIANLNKVFARLEAKTDKLIKQVQKNSNDIEDLKKEINSLELKIDSKRGNN